MSGDGFIFDSGRILFRQNGREFSPNSIEGVVSVTAGSRGHGCRLGLINGNSISVQWGSSNYCSNRNASLDSTNSFSPDAEIAIFSPSDEWHNFGSDTVDGWKSVAGVMNYIATYSKARIVRQAV
jgi:hypothetical protein